MKRLSGLSAAVVSHVTEQNFKNMKLLPLTLFYVGSISHVVCTASSCSEGQE